MATKQNLTAVYNVAEYVLSKFESLTTMKLQKLVYYCQSWSLVWDELPLFNEEFEAWANGPVCRELYNAHQGKFVVSQGDFARYSEDYEFNAAQTETMNAVIDFYGDKDPHWLSELTHMEDPWRNARKGIAPGKPSDKVITKESMQEYYAGLE